MKTASALRKLSKDLLGGLYRLEIAAAIAQADAGDLFAHRIAEVLKLQDKVVQPEMKHFARLGFLEEHEEREGDQRVFYGRSDTVFWDLVRQLHDEVSAREPAA